MTTLLTTFGRGALAVLMLACAASCSSDCPKDPDCASSDSGSGTDAPDGAPEGAPDGGPTEAIAAFCDATLGRSPKLYETCCNESDKATNSYRAFQGTAAALAWECASKLSRSAALGRVTLDDAVLTACEQAVAAAYDASGCGVMVIGFDWEASPCRGVVIGQQASGQPCRYRYECADGLTCNGYNDGVDGTCAPPEANNCLMLEYTGAADDVVDSLFGHHPACAPGWSCAHTDQYGTCYRTVAEGKHCISPSDCDQGLTCRVGTCGTLPLGDQGAPCFLTTECVAGLFCQDTGGAQGSCAPRKAAGDPCKPAASGECRGACASSDGVQGVCVEYCGSG